MIKSVVTENQPKSEKPFPKLMVMFHEDSKGTIVFFTEKYKGIIVHGAGYRLDDEGLFMTNWDMTCFTDFHGTVTLSND